MIIRSKTTKIKKKKTRLFRQILSVTEDSSQVIRARSRVFSIIASTAQKFSTGGKYRLTKPENKAMGDLINKLITVEDSSIPDKGVA